MDKPFLEHRNARSNVVQTETPGPDPQTHARAMAACSCCNGEEGHSATTTGVIIIMIIVIMIITFVLGWLIGRDRRPLSRRDDCPSLDETPAPAPDEMTSNVVPLGAIYVTAGGEKYHRSRECRTIHKAVYKATLRKPCQMCFPDQTSEMEMEMVDAAAAAAGAARTSRASRLDSGGRKRS